jgi:hypothetical protein
MPSRSTRMAPATPRPEHPDDPSNPRPGGRTLVPTLALVWSAAMLLLSSAWLVELLPHPFSDEDLLLVGGVFHTSPPIVGIVATGTVGLAGALTALTLRRVVVRGDAAALARRGILAAWVLAGCTGLVFVHGRLLAFLGYTPLLLTRGWFDAELRSAFVTQMDADLLLLVLAVVGALLWVASAIVSTRAGRSACATCGRQPGWTHAHDVARRQRALRIGRAAVAVAIVAAMVYPAIRLPWAFGIGFGLDAASWDELRATPGMVATGVGLASAGIVGAVLMLGLVQDWGVRFPRWMVGLAGRRVPPMLAILPASIVALALIASGRGWLVALAADRLPDVVGSASMQLVGMLSFLPWGLGLAVATGAYALRRRGDCNDCERGSPETLPSAHR